MLSLCPSVLMCNPCAHELLVFLFLADLHAWMDGKLTDEEAQAEVDKRLSKLNYSRPGPKVSFRENNENTSTLAKECLPRATHFQRESYRFSLSKENSNSSYLWIAVLYPENKKITILKIEFLGRKEEPLHLEDSSTNPPTSRCPGRAVYLKTELGNLALLSKMWQRPGNGDPFSSLKQFRIISLEFRIISKLFSLRTTDCSPVQRGQGTYSKHFCGDG